MSDRRRPRDDEPSHRSGGDSRKRSHFSSSAEADDRHHRPSFTRKRPTFPSYLDSPDLSPKIRLLCEILAKTPSPAVEAALDDCGVRITQEDVEEVLKLSYAFPGAAVKFFRWAGAQIRHQHSPYAWNLVVDLLGKNDLFEAMWDAVKTMRAERTLSLATFASIFSSYVAAGRFEEALTAFEAMNEHDVPRDVAALNSLLSAVCRLGQTARAREFLGRARKSILPDADSYAILLEGWENEGDPQGALDTFAEMVGAIGWDPANVPSYDSFLIAISRGQGGVKETLKHLDIMREKRCLPGIRFFRSALEEALKLRDIDGATVVWQVMVRETGCRPDTAMYNSMIALQCYVSQIDAAYAYLDEMVMYGVFPDEKTYNLMLQFLLKGKKLRDAAVIFNEMAKNEFLPSYDNAKTAFRVFLDSGDTVMAMKVWKFMVKNESGPLEESGNILVLKLRDVDMLPEACKCAEYMAENGIKVHSSTLSKLRNNLVKLGKGSLYDQILRKWKSH